MPTARRFDPITAVLERLRERIHPLDEGQVASYIPELATADPQHFGLALCSTEGNTYDAGDTEVAFTIQSISKPFVFALALADRGLDGVLDHVGVEPSGDAYNAISLDPESGRPANPMINAGAIVTTSLVAGADPGERFERIVGLLGDFAGRRLEVNEVVFESERLTGDRNRALGYLVRHAGVLEGEALDAVDTYIRQCSVQVTAADLAVMAGTLAGAGQNPVTGEQVVPEEVAQHTLAVMATCGMYDGSGNWLLRVGLPAKSGVGGGLVAVSPNQFGIGIFSPPLDRRGNPVRALAVCERLSEEFALHLLHRRPGRNGVAEVDRGRSDDGVRRPSLVRLHGDLDFAAMEQAADELRATVEAWRDQPEPERVLIDLSNVGRCHPVASSMLDALVRDLAGDEVDVDVVDPTERHLVRAADEFCSVDAALAAAAAEERPGVD
ncbi:MAG: glutaminase A [Acidimicrobiia bacterium]|nr:glutaminase A [Acidimicrobiia bacterium]